MSTEDTCAAKSKVGGRENDLNQPAQMGDALLFPANRGRILAKPWSSATGTLLEELAVT